MTGILNDLRLSLRQLRRTPGFGVAAVLVLALGIGINAATFGLCYSLAFSPRPFEKPDELIQIYSRNSIDADADYRRFSYPAWRQLAENSDTLSGIMAHRTLGVGLNERTQGGETRRAIANAVSANFFRVLGVQVAQGRAFAAEEERPGAEIPVAIASHALWRRAGFDPAFLGRTVRVNERPFTIVGITPPGFMGTSAMFGPEIFLPLGVLDSLGTTVGREATGSLERADAYTLLLIGRLRAGVSAAKANESLKLASASAERAFPTEYRGQQFSLRPLPRFVSGTAPAQEGSVVTLTFAVLGMTGSVLLIVCLNLASMFLARGQARRREFAIRLAIGGGRARIVRQLLTEGLVLSVFGGALGIVLGRFGIDALVSAVLERLPVSVGLDFATTPSMVIGTAVFSIVATLAFALGPALRHTGMDVIDDLKQQAGDNAPTRRRRFIPRHPLVAAQIALSLSLLISAGLFLQMTRQATSVDTGFEARDTVVIEADAGLADVNDAQGLSLYTQLEEKLRALPGAQFASVAAALPFSSAAFGEMVRRAGTAMPAGVKPASAADGLAFRADWNAVGASYFDTLGLAVRQGRVFTDAESQIPGSPRVAVIDEVLARQLWPEGNALGRSIEFESTTAGAATLPLEVVGIVPMVRDDAFDKSPGGAVYVPFAQGYRPRVFFQVRATPTAVAGMVDAVQQEIRRTAPGLPSFRALRFVQHMATSIDFWGLRLVSSLFATLGIIATLISLVGVYGTMSYGVLRRTREIGIRIAIGATPGGVRRMVLEEGLTLGIAGVCLGLLLGTGMGRVLDSVFVDVGAFDPVTFTLAPLLLLAASVGASLLPARRATAVNPVTALRAD
ncbi:MAG: ADOP family duplicated permease [Vicinamibacteria bacterium]